MTNVYFSEKTVVATEGNHIKRTPQWGARRGQSKADKGIGVIQTVNRCTCNCACHICLFYQLFQLFRTLLLPCRTGQVSVANQFIINFLVKPSIFVLICTDNGTITALIILMGNIHAWQLLIMNSYIPMIPYMFWSNILTVYTICIGQWVWRFQTSHTFREVSVLKSISFYLNAFPFWIHIYNIFWDLTTWSKVVTICIIRIGQWWLVGEGKPPTLPLVSFKKYQFLFKCFSSWF